jgi:hypothetical protein
MKIIKTGFEYFIFLLKRKLWASILLKMKNLYFGQL